MTTITNGMRPIHPGEVLREEFLLPLGLTAHALAMALHGPAPRINDVVRERRAVTADTALRLAKYFGTSAEFWMGLQADFDMATARATMTDVLSRITCRESAWSRHLFSHWRHTQRGATLREFDQLCLPPVEPLQPEQKRSPNIVA